MVGAFVEAIRATFQPCTFLLVVPTLVGVLVAGTTVEVVASATAGAVLGGWLLAANRFVLDGVWLQVSAIVVLAVLATWAVAPHVRRLAPLRRRAPSSAIAFGLASVAAMWWRPCVGAELGAILTAAQHGLGGQLPGMTAYMLGAMVPVVAVALVVRAAAPAYAQLVGVPAAVLGGAVAVSLAIGGHDSIVVTLTDWSR